MLPYIAYMDPMGFFSSQTGHLGGHSLISDMSWSPRRRNLSKTSCCTKRWLWWRFSHQSINQKKKNNPGGEKPRMTYYEVWEFWFTQMFLVIWVGPTIIILFIQFFHFGGIKYPLSLKGIHNKSYKAILRQYLAVRTTSTPIAGLQDHFHCRMTSI